MKRDLIMVCWVLVIAAMTSSGVILVCDGLSPRGQGRGEITIGVMMLLIGFGQFYLFIGETDRIHNE